MNKRDDKKTSESHNSRKSYNVSTQGKKSASNGQTRESKHDKSTGPNVGARNQSGEGRPTSSQLSRDSLPRSSSSLNEMTKTSFSSKSQPPRPAPVTDSRQRGTKIKQSERDTKSRNGSLKMTAKDSTQHTTGEYPLKQSTSIGPARQSRREKNLGPNAGARNQPDKRCPESPGQLPSRPNHPERLLSSPFPNDTSFGRRDSTASEQRRLLQKTLDLLKIKKAERSDASKLKNEVVAKIMAQLQRSENFREIETMPTGSYFENLKISNPDEFDVMFTLRLPRVDVEPVGKEGAYFAVKFKRHPQKHFLEQFLKEDNTLCARKMLEDFRRQVKEAKRHFDSKLLDDHDLKLEPKRPNCPAVTLQLKSGQHRISIDLVLGLEITGSWPVCTKEGMQIEAWLGTKTRRDYRFKSYYLVPKYEGGTNADLDGVKSEDFWRISFSHIEKEIVKNHGEAKTCCEAQGAKCCRKQCLKLLKHLLTLLKSRHEKELSKFCSYYMKTMFLHSCTKRTKDVEWEHSNIPYCFQLLLEDCTEHLKAKDLPNFFIPEHNLLGSVSKSSCNKLAGYIEYEYNNGFPIFKTAG